MVSWASKNFPIRTHLGHGFENITVQELYKRLKEDHDIFILDVRTLPEYKNDGHIEGSTLIPIQVLAKKLHEIKSKKNIKVYIICHTGGRSAYASELLLKSGFKKVVNVVGGMEAWKRLNYPYTAKK
ncbi:MAG: sulfurtransferase [bacterium]|nr:MAG: sulfurtransferase [bacterium]